MRAFTGVCMFLHVCFMNILFIHQNFPGQFKHLAPALAAAGHRCVALTLRVKKPVTWAGVEVVPYSVARTTGTRGHPWLIDLESKVIRGEACFRAACTLRDTGFVPDIILGHPGWGETLFLRDVWPTARIGLYFELYHQADDSTLRFDPEFATAETEADALRIRMKNLNNTMHLPICDLAISPTRFQAATFPPAYQERISVIHDGIDTDLLKPNPQAKLALPNHRTFDRSDEVITFVNRNLEPYRGYHVFMRALPQLLRQRPKAQVLLVGGDDVSYGPPPAQGGSWKDLMISEVRGQISDADWQRVHFLGRIPYRDFISLLQVSRLHVYLTYPFVLSWSLFEAMSVGATILASNTAPLHEAIEHGKTGHLVDFFDTDGLVRAAHTLLEDAPLRDRMGQAARQFVQERYDLRRVCLPQQMQWVNRLAQRMPRPIAPY